MERPVCYCLFSALSVSFKLKTTLPDLLLMYFETYLIDLIDRDAILTFRVATHNLFLKTCLTQRRFIIHFECYDSHKKA